LLQRGPCGNQILLKSIDCELRVLLNRAWRMVAYMKKKSRLPKATTFEIGTGGVIPAGSLFSICPEGLEADISGRADAFLGIITPLMATIAAFAAFLRRLLLDCVSISAAPSLG
ncbi:MAG: hypothetical protein ACYCPO_03275, partial [Acidobacteriaceae bacterium]